MNPLTLAIALGFVAGAFVITYGASRVAFLAKRPSQMFGAVMLCAAGLLWPVMLTAAYADRFFAPSAVPVVALLAALSSVGAHFLALRKL